MCKPSGTNVQNSVHVMYMSFSHNTGSHNKRYVRSLNLTSHINALVCTWSGTRETYGTGGNKNFKVLQQDNVTRSDGCFGAYCTATCMVI